MTDITPEQRAAWARLSNSPDAPSDIGGSVEQDAALIAPFLPSSLTAPEPALPTEPGYYLTPNESVVMLDDERDWTWGDGGLVADPRELMPLRRLVPEPVAAPAPVVTPEQRAAWERLDEMAAAYTPEMEALLLIIAPLLPSSLTAPEPALPTEPGLYASDATMTEVYYDGETWTEVGSWAKLANPRRFAPLRRLVPERPPITREQIEQAVLDEGGGLVTLGVVTAILARVNGADQ